MGADMSATWPADGLECAYCRNACIEAGPVAFVEMRDHVVIKRDGTRVPGASVLHVCAACNERLPVDR